MKKYILFIYALVVSYTSYAQPQVPATTTYTRGFLRTTNSASALTYLGASGGGGSQTPLIANVDGAGFTVSNVVIITTSTNSIYQGQVSNSILQQVELRPTNTYTAAGTLSTTNNKTFFKGSSGAFAGIHRGDGIVILGNNQYVVTSVTNSNDTIGVCGVVGGLTGSGTQLNIAFQVLPNAVHFMDDSGNVDIGGIGNDGSYVIESDNNGNSGKIMWLAVDGVHSVTSYLNNNDNFGYSLQFGSALNGFGQGMFAIYPGAAYHTGAVMPNSIFAVRGLTNTEDTQIPFYLPLTGSEVDVTTAKFSVVTATNTITASNFSGKGTLLTALNAANVTSGNLPSGRLNSYSVTIGDNGQLYNDGSSQTFSSANSFPVFGTLLNQSVGSVFAGPDSGSASTPTFSTTHNIKFATATNSVSIVQTNSLGTNTISGSGFTNAVNVGGQLRTFKLDSATGTFTVPLAFSANSAALAAGLTVGTSISSPIYAGTGGAAFQFGLNSTGAISVRGLNMTVEPTITDTNGFSTALTNQYALAATGWTNTNAFNCVVYATGTAVSVTWTDGTNTILTPTISTLVPFVMHPSYKLTAVGGLSGIVIAQ